MYGVPFYKEVFNKNNIDSITNWGVVERPLKQVDTDPPLKDILCYPKGAAHYAPLLG